MVRAIYEHGTIKPLDPIPNNWSDGIELRIEATIAHDDTEAIQQWVADLERRRTSVTMDDYEALRHILEDDDREQKALLRKKMETE